ncbi:DUF7507 domain-containing protein [Dongia sedimenti]|uniref:DUF11 domain-containing protein n=1 Tax=Dongia sedimenti TaxID=3064282 RepID=A0ABU0YRS3_9PROT|nr:hypothetical protein [Rhodospirillaceae bacterium R-7]
MIFGRRGNSIAVIAVCALIALVCPGLAGSALAQAFPGCTAAMYLTQSPGSTPATFYAIDVSTNPFSFAAIATEPIYGYNATAYNPADNYIYAMRTGGDGAGHKSLLRIGSNGLATQVHVFADTETALNSAGNLVAGEIGADGYYYVYAGGSATTLFKISLSDYSVTSFNLGAALYAPDFAWYGGRLYGISSQNGQLYSIDPSTGVATAVGPQHEAVGYGAMFGASNGIFGSSNTGGFYRIDPNTGTTTLISGSPASGGNDGAKCYSTALTFPIDLSISIADSAQYYRAGTNVGYTIVVGNEGPYGTQGATVNAGLPSGISEASWTCGQATAGAACGAATGTGAINNTVNLPAGSSVTYSLTLTIPAEFSGDLTVVASVSPPADSGEADSSNNSASDTDTQALPQMAVTKIGALDDANGNGYADAGEAVRYSIAVRNAGNVTLAGVAPQDAGPSFNGHAAAGTLSNFSPASADLPAGAEQIFTATYDLAQADIDHGGPIANSATASGTDPLANTVASDSVGATTTLDQVANLSLETSGTLNDTNGNGVADAGETISYSYVVSNAGNVTLTDVAVSDGLATASEDPQTLAPGASFTFHASYVITQSDIDASAVASTATVGGIDPLGDAITSDPVSTSIPLSQVAALSLEKSGALNDANGNGVADSGETIIYTYDVTNTGNVTLTGVTVTEDPATATEESQTLAPGESSTSHSTYTITQADIDAGSVSSVATASGVDPPGNVVTSNPASAMVTLSQVSALTIQGTSQARDSDGNGRIDAGERIDYSYVVSNSGNTTLTDVTVSNSPTAVSENPQTVTPGDSFTFHATYTVTQADIDVGTVESTASASGSDLEGAAVVSAPVSLPTQITQVPQLTVQQTGELDDWNGNGYADAGESISYIYQATNTGNVTLTDVVVSSAPAPVAEGPQTLAPGGSFTFHANYTIAQADIESGAVTSTATASGTDPLANAVVSDPTSETIQLTQASGLSVETFSTLNDTNGNGVIDPGETIDYSYQVSDIGNVTLTGVTVSNAPAPVSENPQTLAPGESFTFHATYTITQADIDAGAVISSATANGIDPLGDPVTSEPVSTTVPLTQVAALSVEKSGTLSDANGNGVADPGETITYTYIVTNTGNVTLTDVLVTDDPATVTGGPQTLGPGESCTFTGTYAATAGDIESGSVTSGPATVGGTDPTGNPVAGTSGETTTVPPNVTAALSLVASEPVVNDANGNGHADAGETISYSYQITNTGNVTLTNVTVNNGPATASEDPQMLAPGENSPVHSTYTIAQADIDAGTVTSSAMASGIDPLGDPVTSDPVSTTVPLTQVAVLSVEKSGTLSDANGNGVADPGETITYTYIVTNTGNVTLTDVTVTDDPATVAGGSQMLGPGESYTFTGTYTATAGGIENGSVTSGPATVGGTDTTGNPVAGTSGETTTVPPNVTAALSLVASEPVVDDANGNGHADAGETISYSYQVTNTGNVTLTDVTVSDELVSESGGPQALATISEDPQSLPAGARFTFHATYAVTQANIDAGFVTRTATASGTDPVGTVVTSTPATAATQLSQSSGLSIEKTGTLIDANGNGVVDPGETITYTYLVTNTGNVTVTGVTVTDDPATVADEPQTLAPGESYTFTGTYTATAGGIDNGSVSSTATVGGTDPSGNSLEGTSNATNVPSGLTRAISLTTTGSLNDANGNGQADVGEAIDFSYLVRNTGTVLLTNVVVTDGLTTVSEAAQSIAAGGTFTFHASYIIAEADLNAGSVTSTATASGTDAAGVEVASDPFSVATSLSAVSTQSIALTKQALLSQVRRGEKVPYLISATNGAGTSLAGVSVTDVIPVGFRYVDGSATIDGSKTTPKVGGRSIIFQGLALPANQKTSIRLELLALSTATPGKHVNSARATDSAGHAISVTAHAEVEIVVEPVFDCGDVIGKVFDDWNKNGYEDDGEPGMPGVRLATVKGWLITTDRFGRFHVPCAELPDQRIGSNFILKLDPRSLPSDYRLTTENPRVVRLTAGKATKLNFGASPGRMVKVDLSDAAFEADGVQLAKRFADRIPALIELLRQEPSVLVLHYAGTSVDAELADRRLKSLEAFVRQRWREGEPPHDLAIETRLESGR